MKRYAVAAAVLGCLALAGCGGNQATTPAEMREISEARDECHELGGTFSQWYGATSVMWRCDFSDPDAPETP